MEIKKRKLVEKEVGWKAGEADILKYRDKVAAESANGWSEKSEAHGADLLKRGEMKHAALTLGQFVLGVLEPS